LLPSYTILIGILKFVLYGDAMRLPNKEDPCSRGYGLAENRKRMPIKRVFFSLYSNDFSSLLQGPNCLFPLRERNEEKGITSC
jgi:hypothetical protein